MLEHGCVEPAFRLSTPGPASGAFVIVHANGNSTWCTTDTAISTLKEWMRRQAVMQDSTAELRANGIKVERVPAEFESEIKRLGEKFSREWVRLVGNEANQIFVPYYAQ